MPCPLTNLFEVLIFLSWSIVLLYFVVGTAYRLSLLGVFTSPLAFIIQAFALIVPLDSPPGPRARVIAQPWLETHAAISIIAYGAFALACVAGVMYLIQERQLKTHRFRRLFFQLPPIADLAVAINRLIITGFILLTIGLLSGFWCAAFASNGKRSSGESASGSFTAASFRPKNYAGSPRAASPSSQ